MEATKLAKAKSVDMKLEVVMIGVSDIDRAKAFYENLGWRFDGDFTVGDDFRAVQMTPPNSGASIIFGKGIRSAKPGLADSLILAVDDIDAAHDDLVARGVDVSEVFHYAGGPFNNTGENPRVGGRDPEGRTYFSFASFEDPDGNGWLLQEVRTRFPGRGTSMDVAALTGFLQEAEQRHGDYDATAPKHHWSQWYGAYLVARERGRAPDEAAGDAAQHMETARR
jgi:catechol 2,3-dioxygenase-like lactoylglutathione lyase family enzyme